MANSCVKPISRLTNSTVVHDCKPREIAYVRLRVGEDIEKYIRKEVIMIYVYECVGCTDLLTRLNRYDTPSDHPACRVRMDADIRELGAATTSYS